MRGERGPGNEASMGFVLDYITFSAAYASRVIVDVFLCVCVCVCCRYGGRGGRGGKRYHSKSPQRCV